MTWRRTILALNESWELTMASPEREIDVLVSEEFSELVSHTWLLTIATKSLVIAFPDSSPGQLSIVITDDECIKSLNKQYRGLDEITDVLAFSSNFEGHWEGEETYLNNETENPADFIFPPNQKEPLGEVIISYPQIVKQAEEHDHHVLKELAILTVHGILHLAGYDHMESADAIVMTAKEMDISMFLTDEILS